MPENERDAGVETFAQAICDAEYALLAKETPTWARTWPDLSGDEREFYRNVARILRARERVWTPKLICRDWRNPMLMACPWLHYDEEAHQHKCCHLGWAKLAKNRAGSPLRHPKCPIGRMSIEDKSYRPRRQA